MDTKTQKNNNVAPSYYYVLGTLIGHYFIFLKILLKGPGYVRFESKLN